MINIIITFQLWQHVTRIKRQQHVDHTWSTIFQKYMYNYFCCWLFGARFPCYCQTEREPSRVLYTRRTKSSTRLSPPSCCSPKRCLSENLALFPPQQTLIPRLSFSALLFPPCAPVAPLHRQWSQGTTTIWRVYMGLKSFFFFFALRTKTDISLFTLFHFCHYSTMRAYFPWICLWCESLYAGCETSFFYSVFEKI